MFSKNSILDEQTLLTVIAIGTLLIYIFLPTPNVLYREDNKNSDIINFGENTDCYGVKTTEIDCPTINQPLEEAKVSEDMPHNLNMHIEDN
jgi:hypothetical protein